MGLDDLIDESRRHGRVMHRSTILGCREAICTHAVFLIPHLQVQISCLLLFPYSEVQSWPFDIPASDTGGVDRRAIARANCESRPQIG
jgi:hypothetical protein